jgi:hypothetical protein
VASALTTHIARLELTELPVLGALGGALTALRLRFCVGYEVTTANWDELAGMARLAELRIECGPAQADGTAAAVSAPVLTFEQLEQLVARWNDLTELHLDVVCADLTGRRTLAPWRIGGVCRRLRPLGLPRTRCNVASISSNQPPVPLFLELRTLVMSHKGAMQTAEGYVDSLLRITIKKAVRRYVSKTSNRCWLPRKEAEAKDDRVLSCSLPGD